MTASVAAALLDIHPYVSSYQLWAEKSGRASPPEPDEDASDAMERGNLIEPVAVEMVRRRHPDWTVTYHNDHAYYRVAERRIGATPDAFVQIPGVIGIGNLQIKSASEEAFRKYWLDPDTKAVVPPLWIAVQAIVEAKLTGCTYAKVGLVVLTWRGTLKLHVEDVPLHDGLWSRLQGDVDRFWQIVDSGEEPDPDWSRDTAAVLDVHRQATAYRKDLTGDAELDAIINSYQTDKASERSAREHVQSGRARILHRLGDAEAGFTDSWNISASVNAGGARVLRIQPRESFRGSF